MPARERLRAIAALLIAVFAMMSATMPVHSWAAGADDITLALRVVVNNYPTDKIGEFILRNGVLFASQGAS